MASITSLESMPRQHVVEHVACDPDDRDADHDAQLVQDLLLAQKRARPAYCFQHLDLELRSRDDGHRANPADAPLLPGPSGSAFWAGVESRLIVINKTRALLQQLLGRS